MLHLTPTLLRDLEQVSESFVSGRSWEIVSGLLKVWERKLSVNSPSVGCGAFEEGSERSQKTRGTCSLVGVLGCEFVMSLSFSPGTHCPHLCFG